MFPAIALGALSAGSGILGSVGSFIGARDQARAQNQAAVNQYKQRLKIRAREYANAQEVYGNNLARYNRQLNEFDRAAALGYGREQLKQNEAIRGANLNRISQSIALAQRGGAAAAAGKTGRSASRLDQNAIGQFVRNQGVLAENLLSGDIARSQRMMDIRNRLESSRNTAYSKVAIAPKPTIEPLAPTQLSGPSGWGLAAGIGSALVSGYTTYDKLAAPDPTKP